MAAQTPELLRQVVSTTGEKLWTANYVWDPNALDWVAMTQPGSSAGGGGATTIADGGDVTQGAKADAAWDGSALAPTAQAILKYLGAKLEAVRALLAGTLTIGGAVSVSNFPASQAVTGPLTDTQLRASAVPISAASLPLPTGAATSAAQTTGNTSLGSIDTKIPAQGQALSAASLPVVLPAAQITTLTPPPAITGFALEAGHLATIDTHLDVALSTRLKPADTLAGVTTVAAVTAITNALPAGTNKIGTVDIATAAATAKGTQGANGVPTQDLKDSGRSARTIVLDSFAVTVVGETLMTMSFSSDNAAATTGTSYPVTAGKRLRIQAIIVNLHTITGNTTAVNVIVRIRANNGGAALVTSPIQFVLPIQGIAAANQASIPQDIAIPDGWEFVAGAGIGVTVACPGFVATTAAPKVDITIIAYEY